MGDLYYLTIKIIIAFLENYYVECDSEINFKRKTQ